MVSYTSNVVLVFEKVQLFEEYSGFLQNRDIKDIDLPKDSGKAILSPFFRKHLSKELEMLLNLIPTFLRNVPIPVEGRCIAVFKATSNFIFLLDCKCF